MKVVAKKIALDLWVCRKFNVLPTEERFKLLTEKHKALLFAGYLETPTDDNLYYAYHYSDKKAEALNNQDETNLSNLGYTTEQIDRIKDNLEKAGLS